MSRAATNASVVNPRMSGIVVAGATALISGLSVFVNSYGVHAVSSPAVYTTAKNLVATSVLAAGALFGRWIRVRRRASAKAALVTAYPRNSRSGAAAPRDPRLPRGLGHWLGLTYVGVIGGGLAFVLFFDGLASTSAASAAFWRDTLVIWVAALAVVFLRERIRWWNVLAMGLLVVGEITLTGGVGQLGAERGELYVLAATVLWAVEVVIAKRLLIDVSPSGLALVRMGVGAVALLGYLTVTGAFGVLWSLSSRQLSWALWSGLLLAAYVATWMTALARARVLDVTSVLVGSALITWLLQWIAGTVTAAPASLGLLLIAVGVGLVLRSGAIGRTSDQASAARS
jgi:drug/metabolite transporter (DMT)-like permease